jgi:single-strand DNA-binding protein
VYETPVTVVGNVADSPRRVNSKNGAVTNFRMASTSRRYDAATQGYVDGRTLWVDIECWGDLSANVSASICKGDPVIVQGSLYTDSWESENGKRSKNCIRAYAVGPNLNQGRAVFTRDRSSSRAAEPVDSSAVGSYGPEAGDDYSTSVEELQAGRDYIGDDEAFDSLDTDLPREPAHA